MSLITDIVAIESYIKALYPTATYKRQEIPTTPTANMFVVSFQNEMSANETGATVKYSREYQIVYFGTAVTDALTRMNDLNRKLQNNKTIGSGMRFESFAISQPFELTSGLDGILGVLSVSVREALDQPEAETVTKLDTSVN